MKSLTPEEVIQALKDGKTVECKTYPNKDWRAISTSSAIYVLLHGNNTFRLAQQEMIAISGVRFPKPEATKLDKDTKYYYPKPTYIDLYDIAHWSDNWLDKFRLSANMVHLTEENAIAHAKALIRISGGTYE